MRLALADSLSVDELSWRQVWRILGRLRESGDCLVWTGCRGSNGRGKVKVTGKSRWVHRVIYAALVGPILLHHDIHHTCGNILCCKPGHLEQIHRSDHTSYHNRERSR